MGWKLLFLFIAVAAAFDEEIPDSYNPECMEQVYQQCDLELLEDDTEFPKDKEELQEVCKMLGDYMACVTNIFDNCEVSDEISQPFYTAKKVFKVVCDENSDIFKAIEENLDCLGYNLDYFGKPCALSPGETQDVNDVINSFSAADEDAFQNEDLCLESLRRVGCIGSKIRGRCGEEAKDGFIKVLQLLDKPFERCASGVKENLNLIVDILDTEEEIAEDLEEMRKKKK